MQRNWLFGLFVCLIFLNFSSTTYGCWPKPESISLSVEKGVNVETVDLIINGDKFASSVLVKLAKTGQPDIIASDIKVISKNQVTCSLDLRDKAVGAWDLIITNLNRFLFFTIKKPAIIQDGFTIEFPAPIITSIEPGEGVKDVKAKISVNGANFRAGANVMLTNSEMDIGALEVILNTDRQIDCQFDLNGVSPGTYSVKVTNNDGKSGILANAFMIAGSTLGDQPTIGPAPLSPVITKISPMKGYNNGSILLEIEGENFSSGLNAKLIGDEGLEISGVNIKVESTTKFNCFFDLTEKPAGLYSIVVTNPDGEEAASVEGFTIETYIPEKLNIKLQSIFFDFDKWEIRADQMVSLDKNLEILKKNPELYIILGSHADERGSREYNLELTAKRGEAVKKYLTDRGIDPERFVIYAYGEDYPAREGNNEAVWQYNRRVDVLEWEIVLTKEQVLSETSKL